MRKAFFCLRRGLILSSGMGSRVYALRMILLGEAGAGKSSLYHWIKYKVSASDKAQIHTGTRSRDETTTSVVSS